MNDDGFIDLIDSTREPEESSGPFETKGRNLFSNRSARSRVHLLVQQIPHLIHEICLCISITALFLVGGTVVLIGTKAVEGLELLFGEG